MQGIGTPVCLTPVKMALWSSFMSCLSQWSSRFFLNVSMDGDVTTLFGRLFQTGITLCVKLCIRTFSLLLHWNSVRLFPLALVLDCTFSLSVRLGTASVSYFPLNILNTSIMSPLALRYFRVGRFSLWSLDS